MGGHETCPFSRSRSLAHDRQCLTPQLSRPRRMPLHAGKIMCHGIAPISHYRLLLRPSGREGGLMTHPSQLKDRPK
jgi:hypothetical protein